MVKILNRIVLRILRCLLRKEWFYSHLLSLPLLNKNEELFMLREEAHRMRLKQVGKGGYLNDTVIQEPQHVQLGDNCTFGGKVYMYGLGGITIGNNCLFAYGSVITTASHDVEAELFRNTIERLPVVIGNNVWVNTNVTILPGVTLADGIIVAAGSVVNRSFLENDIIIGGVPARRIRSRYDAS